MSDLISRQDAIDAIEDADMQVYSCGATIGVRTHLTKEEIVAIIDRVQPAEPERKKGRLKTVGFLTCQCSECGAQFHELEYTNFCPNCGADMRGE